MIAMFKWLNGPWDTVKGYLRDDLNHLEAAINQRWAATFSDDNILSEDAINEVIAVKSESNEFTDDNVFAGSFDHFMHHTVQGTNASYEVLNASENQNWYFGVKDSDSNALYIGKGYGTGQGVTPALKVTTGNAATFTSTIAERARTTPMGEWIAISYANSNFTGAGVDADWDVGSGDVGQNRYMLVGKTLFWSIQLTTTTVSNTPATLRILCPGGFTFANLGQYHHVAYANDNGTVVEAFAYPGSATELYLTKTNGAVWANATNNTYVYFNGFWEIA